MKERKLGEIPFLHGQEGDRGADLLPRVCLALPFVSWLHTTDRKKEEKREQAINHHKTHQDPFLPSKATPMN